MQRNWPSKNRRTSNSSEKSDGGAKSMMYAAFTTGSSRRNSGSSDRNTSLAEAVTTSKRNSAPSALKHGSGGMEIRKLSSIDTAKLRHFSRSRATMRATHHYVLPQNQGWAKSKDLYMNRYSLRFANAEAEKQYEKLMRSVHDNSRRIGSSAICAWMAAWLIVDLALYEGNKLTLRASLRGALCALATIGIAGTKRFQKYPLLSGRADVCYFAALVSLSSVYLACFNHTSVGGVPPGTSLIQSQRLSYNAMLPVELLILMYSSFSVFKLPYLFSQCAIAIACITYVSTNAAAVDDGFVAPVASSVTFFIASIFLSIGARHWEIASRYEFRYGVHDQFQRGVIAMMKSKNPDSGSSYKSNLQFINWNPEEKLRDLMSQTFDNDTMQSFIDVTLGGDRYRTTVDSNKSSTLRKTSKQSMSQRRLNTHRSRSIVDSGDGDADKRHSNISLPRKSDMTHVREFRARSSSTEGDYAQSRRKSHSALFKIPFFIDEGGSAELIKYMNTWNFGPGGLFQRIEEGSAAYKKYPLSVTTFLALTDLNCLDDLGIPTTMMKRAIMMMESNYKKPEEVSYHNALHACDVVQSTYYMLQTMDGGLDFFEPLEVFAMIFGSCVHDLAHPGKNNNYLINTHSSLAITYNDRSVLENMHISTAFKLFEDKPAIDFSTHFDLAQYKRYRQLIIEIVIGTDLTRHFEDMQRFESQLPLQKTETRHRSILSATIVHAADIGSVIKEWDVYRKWIDMLFIEFYQQGDVEKSLGLEVASFMDRDVSSPPQAQKGFINYIVQPLYKRTLGKHCPGIYEDVFEPRFAANLEKLDEWDKSGKGIEHLREEESDLGDDGPAAVVVDIADDAENPSGDDAA